MQIININDVTILVTEIENVSHSRRSNERLAVSSLLAEAFPGTSLGHHLNGAPYIHEKPEVSISVSHSQSHAALAVATNADAIGIDIEAPRSQLHNVATRFLSPDELAQFSEISDGLLRAWTAKEAIFKCAGFSGVNFASDIQISLNSENPLNPATATLRNKTFSLHWLPISSHMLCLAIPE
jgi:phosphopantetheinyl transferase